MKFNDLVYFYAVMSSFSDNPSLFNKRKMAKTAFTDILKNIDVASNAQLLKNLLNTDSAIQSFLGSAEKDDISLIKEIVFIIAKNPQIIITTIQTRMGKDCDDNMIDYLNRQARDKFPELDEYSNQFNQWQAIVLHDGSEEKPETPILETSSFWCCFNKSKKRDRQSLLNENEKVDSCRLV